MTNPTTRRTGEPRLASVASWAVLVASFGLSASTWIALARLAGFTDTLTIPQIGVTLAMAWLMPIAVDGYVVVALVLWMSPVPAKVAAFARKNTYGAAGTGIAAQSAYHLLSTMDHTDSKDWWRVVMAAIVGAIPPAVAGLAVHMRALIRRESARTTTATSPAQAADGAPSTVPAVPGTVAGTAITSDPSPSSPDGDPTAPAPGPVAAEPKTPTPADVADRITKPRTTIPAPATVAGPVPRPTRTRPTGPGTPARTLAPSTADTHVTESDAAQLSLPVVPGDLLTRAAQVAEEYRTEHGTPITPGQLAVRLKVTSEQAAQALAVLNLGPDSPTKPIPTVNGHRPARATR